MINDFYLPLFARIVNFSHKLTNHFYYTNRIEMYVIVQEKVVGCFKLEFFVSCVTEESG